MSTLNVANISDDQSTLTNGANPSDNLNNTTTVDTKFVTNGSAKAWVNFNGTGTVAIRDSMNVSSLVDNGVGNYVVNYSSSMKDSNSAVSGAIPYAAWTGTERVTYHANSVSSTIMGIQTLVPFSAYFDVSSIFGTTHGDLA